MKNVQSWGRRRRRRSITADDKKFLTNNTELHREIIVESISRLNDNDVNQQEKLLAEQQQQQMYCATKTTMIIGIITLFMLQVRFDRNSMNPESINHTWFLFLNLGHYYWINISMLFDLSSNTIIIVDIIDIQC